MTCRAYAVRAGSVLRDAWPVDGDYHLRVDGPNGFMREFVSSIGHGFAGDSGSSRWPGSQGRPPGAVGERGRLRAAGRPDRRVVRCGTAAGTAQRECRHALVVRTEASRGWYDFSVRSGEPDIPICGPGGNGGVEHHRSGDGWGGGSGKGRVEIPGVGSDIPIQAGSLRISGPKRSEHHEVHADHEHPRATATPST